MGMVRSGFEQGEERYVKGHRAEARNYDGIEGMSSGGWVLMGPSSSNSNSRQGQPLDPQQRLSACCL